MRTQKQRVGDYGERVAARYLRRHGYWIVARNWRAGHKELDLIAIRLGTVAFIEVKTRTYTEAELDELPPPRQAVHAEKQRLTRQAAQRYLYEHPTWRKPRMDVIEVLLAPQEHANKAPRVRRIHHLIGAY